MNGGSGAGTLAGAAAAVLRAAAPAEKLRLTQAAAASWHAGAFAGVGTAEPPARPARPDRPLLLPPRDMPKRRAGGIAGRIALLHALAHIELNAVDLAWDLVARFAGAGLPRTFFDDWVRVASEEALHHELVARRLAHYGAAYGDLPAHDGLWEAATETAHDLLARLAVVPLVLEARGLDVTPAMIERLETLGDGDSAAVLRRIYQDEIGHVETGCRWFRWLCAARGLDPAPTWQSLVRRHFRGALKPPFNDEARRRAGLTGDYYAALAADQIPGP